jgi:antitoxin VapB
VPISIKNEEAERLARQLADLTGETITGAIQTALAERFERLKRARLKRSLSAELTAIALRCAGRPDVSSLSDNEILGYDDSGVPTR